MPPDNLGYESCSHVVHGKTIEAPKRYTELKPMRHVGHGLVCSARDENERDNVAIKKVERIFEHAMFAKRALREIRILRHLRHENVLDMRNVFFKGTRETFEDIYVVSDLMSADLGSILKSTQSLSDDHYKYLLYNVLRGLKYVHSAGVVHRDLKPRNILVNSNDDVKICDFGSARICAEGEACQMTEYVCTRWYRAPEVLCTWSMYGTAMDVWGAGCVLAEMFRRKPLFAGRHTQEQVEMIVDAVGAPSEEALRSMPNERCRRFIEALPASRGEALEGLVPGASPEALEVLRDSLRFHPGQRPSAEQVLQRRYFFELHCPEDEPARAPLDTADFEFERREVDLAELREEIFSEALRYHPARQEQHSSVAKRRPPGEAQLTREEEGDGG